MSTAMKEEAPIACMLGVDEFRARTAAIRDLARRSLRHASRPPLSLILTYEAQALDDVRELVGMEQACCSFLRFELQSDANGVLLTITAPEVAAEAADALFDHFAPELAASTTRKAS